jgi:hypothetical protein
MADSSKTLYLWDLADTLFPEVWDKRKSGFETYDDYVKSLGFDLKTVSPRDYEWAYEIPFKTSLLKLNLAEGFKETLSWTKNNVAFTTGNKEQLDWRQVQLGKKYNIDIKRYLWEVRSTFDFGNTNQKTKKMLADILKQKFAEGYKTVVYTDDNKTNCDFFISAVKLAAKEGANFNYRLYNIRHGLPTLTKISKNYFKIGNLLQLLKQEKIINHHRRRHPDPK